MSLNQDPVVINSVKQQFQNLSFAYTGATGRILTGLAENPLLIEKRWNAHERGSKPYFVTLPAHQAVSVDTEACGITLAPEHRSSAQNSTETSNVAVLHVDDPEIRLSRRPASASANVISNDGDDYFQSQVIFYLSDGSGAIHPSLKVQCNRPHFLVGNGLVEFATEAVSEALKVRPETRGSHSAAPQSVP